MVVRGRRPDDAPEHAAYPVGTDGRDALVVTWGQSDSRSVISAETGETWAATECPGSPSLIAGVIPSSTDGRYVLHGSLLVDLETGDNRCIRPDETDAETFVAVDDAGVAYAERREAGGTRVVVRSTLSGEDGVAPLSEAAVAPVGFIGEGDLAVHYDEGTGGLSANPLIPFEEGTEPGPGETSEGGGG